MRTILLCVLFIFALHAGLARAEEPDPYYLELAAITTLVGKVVRNESLTTAEQTYLRLLLDRRRRELTGERWEAKYADYLRHWAGQIRAGE